MSLVNQNLKISLYENAKKSIFNNLEKKIKEIEESQRSFIRNLIYKISEKSSLLALLPFQSNVILKERESINRHNYFFPSFLNVGELKKWANTPSKILKEKNVLYGFEISTPFLMPIGYNSVAFFNNQKESEYIFRVLETMGIKLISSLPDGLVRVIVIDKNAAGKNFPTITKLSDRFKEVKPLSEDSVIEKELLALKNQIEKISRSINKNGFKNIEQYNKETEEIPQVYKIVFIANFPIGFSKKAIETLTSILEAGPGAGIYVFMTMSLSLKNGFEQTVSGVSLNEILKNCVVFDVSLKPHSYTRDKLIPKNINVLKYPLRNEEETRRFLNTTFKINFELPDYKEMDSVIRDLNEKIENINLKPIIDIEKTLPNELWTGSSGKGLSAPFAKSGIENVYLNLGINEYGEDEPVHHGIIGGATGSGKTVTLHSMILHLAMKYSPKELNFWLLDYKEGTEFAVYKDFPYVQILSMESEIEFGHEVLQRAVELMERRGKLFKKVGASNLHTYNSRVSEEERLPRILIIIDEFQMLFPKNRISVTAESNRLIDLVLRLGRSFGINLLLSTQTLKGVDLDPQLLSNMPLRIALRMDQKDAIKIFGENNTAPQFLKYTGEGIYNRNYGDPAENIFFQSFFAHNEAVHRIKKMLTEKIEKEIEKPFKEKLVKNKFVYFGDRPGNIESNLILKNMLEQNNVQKFSSLKFFIGEPAGLSKEHSYLEFEEQDFADNFIIVGPDIEKAASLFYLMNLQLKQSQRKSIIYFANFNKQLEEKFEQTVYKYIDKPFSNSDSDKIIEEIESLIESRKKLSKQQLSQEPHIFLEMFFIENSRIFNDNSYSKDSPVKKLQNILKIGSEYNIHLVIYSLDFLTLMQADFSREMNKFRKKIAFKGGNSLKIFGEEGNFLEFSKSNNVAIADSGNVGGSVFKFKPYLIPEFKIEKETKDY